jgi:drug/metabolite transporter (DMT)-like permease
VVLGQLAWFAGLKNASFFQLNLASLVTPILAIIIAYLILKETPNSAQYLGGIFIFLGATLSFIANVQVAKKDPSLNILMPCQAIETNMGFRGV